MLGECQGRDVEAVEGDEVGDDLIVRRRGFGGGDRGEGEGESRNEQQRRGLGGRVWRAWWAPFLRGEGGWRSVGRLVDGEKLDGIDDDEAIGVVVREGDLGFFGEDEAADGGGEAVVLGGLSLVERDAVEVPSAWVTVTGTLVARLGFGV